MATISEELADFALGLDPDDIPPDVLALARRHVLDTLGIALASSGFDFGRAAHAAGRALGAGDEATVLGFGTRLPAAGAALVNGALAHGLDFDDTHVEAVYHASAPALAAALAAGEAAGRSGRDTLVAYAIGLELGCRLAGAAPGAFHDRGLHPTALCGTFAAAAVAARLAGDSRQALVSALGLCGSLAGGILELRESWLKRLHPGWAAHAGLAAAALGRHGFRGPATVLEGPHGFYAAHVGHVPEPARSPARDLGRVWHARGIALKPYPCCHLLHAFVDAALALREEAGVRPEEITAIECLLTERLAPIVAEPRAGRLRPPAVYDALFSLYYVVALALVRGAVDVAAFHDEPLDDPRVLALAARTTWRPDPSSDYPRHFPGEVRLTLRDGRVLARRCPTSHGSPDWPLSDGEVEAKFHANAGRVLPPARAKQVVELAGSLEEQPDLRPLLQACVAPATGAAR